MDKVPAAWIVGRVARIGRCTYGEVRHLAFTFHKRR